MLRALDPLLFSSVWAAWVAASLVLAASLAMELQPSLAVIALATAGTLVVYNVDRLRDLERDRSASPRRSAFVERNRPLLAGLVGAAALLCLFLALQMEPGVWMLCAGALAIGLLHRRLKGGGAFKAFYVSAVWVGIVVGLPALALQGGETPRGALHVAWVVAGLGGPLGANLIASNLGDLASGAGGSSGPGSRARRRLALTLCLVAAGIAGIGPSSVKPLVWVGVAEAASIWAYRPDERYRLAVLDGALLVGGLAAALLSWP
jgi:hypothetical protein